MKTLQIEELKNIIEVLKGQLEQYERDPMAHDELAKTIQADHDAALFEMYASVLDQFPFYVCSARNAASFAEWIASCDHSFYRQSLNDFADSYDVESLDEYKYLESQIDDLESELFDLENSEEE